MLSTEQRYADEELFRRGKELYEKIKPQVDPGNVGKILAIDIDTGEWEIGNTPVDAGDRLRARVSNPEIYCMRIGYRAVYHFGGRSSRIEE